MFIGTPQTGKAPWTPSNLSPTPLAWFDAKTLSSLTVDASNRVQSWASKTGSLTATIANSSNRGLYRAATTDILFDAYIDYQFSAAGFPFGSSPGTVVAVMSMTTDTNFSIGYGGGNSGNGVFRVVGGGNIGGFRNNVDTTAPITALNQNRVILDIERGTSRTVRVDGGTAIGNGSVTINTANNGKAYIGAPFGNYYAHRGTISEVLFLAGTLSTDDIAMMEGYLAWKWRLQSNLPADHRYRSAAPTI